MWVYQTMWEGSNRIYSVGFYNPKGEWHPIQEYGREWEAQRLVHYLNGGNRGNERMGNSRT